MPERYRREVEQKVSDVDEASFTKHGRVLETDIADSRVVKGPTEEGDARRYAEGGSNRFSFDVCEAFIMYVMKLNIKGMQGYAAGYDQHA